MPTPTLKRKRAAPSPAWHLLLVLGGAGMIAGSCNSWLASGSVFSSQGVSGIFGDDFGEVSLIAGIVLTLAALLMLRSGSLHLLGQLATGAAGAGLAAAGYFWYFIFRLDLIPDLRPFGAYPGWGMLLVILSSLVAFVASCAISVSGGK
jgi:hypothetical protein